jgi:hypothetical protein
MALILHGFEGCNIITRGHWKGWALKSETFQGHFRAISGPYQGHIRAISGTFQGLFRDISGPFQGHFRAISGPFQGHFRAILGPFQGPKKSRFSGPTPSNAPDNDVAPLKTIMHCAIKTIGTLIVITSDLSKE